jgi:hypothetical protein
MLTTPTGPLSLVRAQRAQRLVQYLRRRRRRRWAAFIGVTVFGLTALPVWVVSQRLCCGGMDDVTRNQAYEIAKAAAIFDLQAGRPPTTVNELVDPPPNVQPIMEALPRDAWGGDYLLVAPAVRGDGRVNVVSAGPDGVFFTGDDVGNWIE